MFIICQIGAREHYAIARALDASGMLAGLLTDFWVPPGSGFSHLPGASRLRDRFHPDLADAKVMAPNVRFLAFELKQRIAKRHGWPVNIARNRLFQRQAIAKISKAPGTNHKEQSTRNKEPTTLFSYSYAARDLFRFAKSRGWITVLGQIDPGPEEERIVAAEHQRYPALASRWQPAPASYWDAWREELDLADRIIVNSDWSRRCLLKEGVSADKLEIVPLVYGTDGRHGQEEESQQTQRTNNKAQKFKVLFLGQIILRKGIGRLLDAMRLLNDEPVELILAGPSEIEADAWADLPNVHWPGPVPRSEVGRIYQDAGCFILPTLSDGYALTQLEALSHGLPVIASRHCGDAVTHGHNGWILDDLEPETIATAIRIAMQERPHAIRTPGFTLDDLATALIGKDARRPANHPGQ